MTGMSVDELRRFFDTAFPARGRKMFVVEAADSEYARVRLKFSDRLLRPGGTISGPAQMTLVDTAMWMAVAATIGERAMDSVTTNINVSFLRRPPQEDMIGEARILKVGRRLAYGEVTISSLGVAGPVAHATCTYSLPPLKSPPVKTTPRPAEATTQGHANDAMDAS